MKRYLYLIFALVICTTSLYGQGQPPRVTTGGINHTPPPMGMNNQLPPPPATNSSYRVISSLLELYIITITDHLNLGTKRSKKFEELYTKYYTDLSNINKASTKVDESSSEQELEKVILEGFNSTDSSTDLKRKYYPLFKEILSNRQILMMYDIERELLWRISLESQRRSDSNSKQ